MSKINKTPIETRLAIERRSAAMLPDRPTQAGYKPWDIRNALFSAIIADKGACLMGEIDRIVEEANAAIDAIRIKSGTLTVPMSHWKGEETPRAECAVRSIYTAGCAVFFVPEDDETKEQARLARLSMAINETVDGEWSDVVVFAGAGGTIPSVDLHFRYVVMPTESEEDAVVTLVGVDSYGEGGGAASGVDEEAVKKLINEEVPKWARAKTKPTYTPEEVKARPATWTPTAEEIGARPSTWMPTAADVDADYKGAAADEVKDHNEDGGSHVDIRLDVTTIRTMLNTVIGTDTGKSMRAVAALVVAEIVGDASDSFDTLEEIAAWIEAHPNDVAAMVKRITDLEAAMGGTVNKTDIINTLDNTALDKPLSAAMGAKLNTMLAEMSGKLDGKATPEQVAKAISDALTGYALKDHNHDGTYAKPSDIPTVPQTLPNPYALNILGKTYNGSSAVALTVEEIIEAIKTASGGVIAWIGDDNSIYLAGNLSDGTYKAYFEVDGKYIEIGELTKGEEEIPEPEPEPDEPDTTTYSIDTTYLVACSSGNTNTKVEGGSAYTTTIIADEGYNLSAIRVKMGGVDITSAAVEGSTVTIENVTGDIAISCIGYKSRIRIYHGDGTEMTVAACEGTGFIPVKTGDVVYIKNVTVETNGNSGLAYYDAGKAYISGYYLGSASVLGGAVNGEATSFNVTAANAAYIRFSAYVIDSTSIITVNEQLT